MGLNKTPYFDLSCDGPGPTLRHERCPAVSHGGWDEQQVLSEATAKGWTTTGRSALCPEHSASANGQASAVKPRKVKSDALPQQES